MLNKSLLQSKLYDKFSNLAFNAIITESFINALPFNEVEFDKTTVNGFQSYSKAVLESLGGFNMCKIPKNNIARAIYDACNDIAIEASKRVCKEEITGANADKTLPEVVDGAAFTDAEYNKFAKNVDNMDLDKVSEIIKDKVVKVIRDEKDSYEKEENLHDELKDAINTGDTSEDEKKTVESYMDLVLSKADPRKHVTLFSKLMDVSYDAISHTTESYTEIPFKTLTTVTIKNTLKGFKPSTNLNSALESMELFGSNANTNAKISDTSLLCGITIFTALETLNSLGLYTPPVQDVREFVDHDHPYTNCRDASSLESAIISEVEKINRACMNTADNKILTEGFDTLTSFSTNLSGITNEEFASVRESVMTAISPVLDNIKSKLDSAVNYKPTAPNSFDMKHKDRTVAQFNKIQSLFGNNPSVSKICLQVNPAEESSVIQVLCRDASNEIVNESFIDVDYVPVFGKYMDFVKESFTDSKLKDSSKNVGIYLTDGSAKMINLK